MNLQGRDPMIRLEDRTALVTGGSRGIGRAAALMLADAGADVGVTCRNRRADAEAVSQEIRGRGRKAFVGIGDHGDPETMPRVIREVTTAFGGLDILVVNAGVWPPDAVPLREMRLEQWTSTCRANLDAVFHTVRAALPVLRAGTGRIILVGSTAGQRGEGGHADYAATKGALIALTRSLAVECAPDLTVNCVAPGWVDTEMTTRALTGQDRARAVAGIPLGRIATPEDIAGPIVFLASDLARHMTGSVVSVNGGSVLAG